MRQIIGIFDESTSRKNSKNVFRTIRESAKQDFWNGGSQLTHRSPSSLAPEKISASRNLPLIS